jgi:protein TonB
LTSIGGRAVQVETPPELAKRPEPIRPPAARAPEMTVPERGARARTGATNVAQAPADARGRTPTRGAEPTPGSTLADTGVRGQGFGLSTGGGAGSGSRLDITGDFCCPEYVLLMLEKIRGNWDQRVETGGQAIVKYTIQRDGTITDVQLERSSGTTALDLNAQRAIYRTRQLLPLPSQFPNPTLPVHLNFEYTR